MSAVSLMLSRLGTGTYTVTRSTPGDYGANTGDYVPGATSAFSARASVQPMSPRERKNLPEGLQTEDVRVMYTEEAIQAADDSTKALGDKVDIGGETFEAVKVEPWGGTLLPHYKSTLVRRGYGE